MPHLPKSTKRPWIKNNTPPPQTGRRNPNSEFYNSTKWRRTRGAYIKKNPLCVVCQAAGIIKQAEVVDHKIPINEGGEKYKWSNLQSMCHTHHNQKSGRESQAAQRKKKENGHSNST